MGEPWRTRYYIESGMNLTTRIKKALFLPADVHLDNKGRTLETRKKQQGLAWEASIFTAPD